MHDSTLQNTRVIANAFALLTKALERIEATANSRPDDKSLETTQSATAEVQEYGRILLGNKIGQLA